LERVRTAAPVVKVSRKYAAKGWEKELSMESVFVQVAGSSHKFTISPELLGSIKMQRDMEVVRKVLRAVKDRKDLRPSQLHIDGLDDFTVGYHVYLLHAAGYIVGDRTPALAGPYPQILVSDLSWDGHEFAGAILADESTWEKVKASVGAEQLVSMPLKVVQELAIKALTAWGLNKLGL
jgi:hypothetical protein